MPYWVKRIILKSGELVTERELDPSVNRWDGPVPIVGDQLEVVCRGRKFAAKVVWGNWSGRGHGPDELVPLRVEEV